jgi:hypothetical protein
MPKTRTQFVKVWNYEIPRALPPPEEPVAPDEDMGTTFLEYFSPITNSEYTVAKRNAEISQVLELVASVSTAPAMKALTKGTGVIIKGNPWTLDDLPPGVCIDDANLEFTYATVHADVEESVNPEAMVEVVWHKCLRGDPLSSWHACRGKGSGRKWIAKTPRKGIALVGVELRSTKLAASCLKVCCFLVFKVCVDIITIFLYYVFCFRLLPKPISYQNGVWRQNGD